MNKNYRLGDPREGEEITRRVLVRIFLCSFIRKLVLFMTITMSTLLFMHLFFYAIILVALLGGYTSPYGTGIKTCLIAIFGSLVLMFGVLLSYRYAMFPLFYPGYKRKN